MQLDDLTGKQFGDWKVLKYIGDRKWLCECQCEKHTIREVSGNSLRRGASTNCGDKTQHISNGPKAFIDVTGQKFGQLTVLKYVGESRFLCECDCENKTKVIRLRKNLGQHSKCDECSNKLKIKPKSETIKPEKKARERMNMVGFKCNDMTVIKDLGDDRMLCECICGFKKEIRGYSLRHPKSLNSYKCNHKINIGDRFGRLTVIGRDNTQPEGKQIVCKCDCNKIILVGSYSLLNGSTKSCGCLKSECLYTKEQVESLMLDYNIRTGCKPFIYDVMTELGVGMTAAYDYINDYELRHLLNSRFGSKMEQEVYQLVSQYVYAELHTRKVVPPNELDIYIPSKKLAIEINGSFWHSADRKDKYYHQHKTIECAKKGIHLIHIFDYEWYNTDTQRKLVSLIKSKLDIPMNRFYARNLKVGLVDNRTAADFENKYHLQCSAVSSVKIGLFSDKGVLVSLMTFGKPRFNSDYQWELIRYCTVENTIITGGAKKLFSYFLNNYNPESIITYCDISKFTGNSYLSLGFNVVKLNAITEPNYVWVNNNNLSIMQRYQTQKHKLVALELGDQFKTEDEIMIRQGYNKVYNSGNIKLEYRKEEKTCLEMEVF